MWREVTLPLSPFHNILNSGLPSEHISSPCIYGLLNHKWILYSRWGRICLAFVPRSWEGAYKPLDIPSDRNVFVIHGGPLEPL
jgi:hypothetical protein